LWSRIPGGAINLGWGAGFKFEFSPGFSLLKISRAPLQAPFHNKNHNFPPFGLFFTRWVSAQGFLSGAEGKNDFLILGQALH